MADWSNEKMKERGAGRRTMADGTGLGLDAQTAALVRVAAALPRGKTPELQARFAAARDARVPGMWIEELLLQSMLVVGYPLALVAFAAWRGVGGPAPVEGGAEDLAHAHLRGALNTGASAEEIEAMLALLEPDLDAEHRQLVREQWTDVKSRKLA